MIRYYTSPQQLAGSPEIRGRAVEWLKCEECDGLGFHVEVDEVGSVHGVRVFIEYGEDPELCELCRGRGGEWGVRLPSVILSCNCGECEWCRERDAT